MQVEIEIYTYVYVDLEIEILSTVKLYQDGLNAALSMELPTHISPFSHTNTHPSCTPLKGANALVAAASTAICLIAFSLAHIVACSSNYLHHYMYY